MAFHLCLYVANMWVVNMTQCDCTAHMFLELKCAIFDPFRKRSDCYLVKLLKSLVAWRKFLSIYDDKLLHPGNVCDGIISCRDVFLKVEVNYA